MEGFLRGIDTGNIERMQQTGNPHLAGILEVSGTFLYRNSGPIIRLQDNSRERIQLLQQLYGGEIRDLQNTKQEWEWKVSGEDAVAIAKVIQPHALSRARETALMIQWSSISEEKWREEIKAFNAKKPSERRTFVPATEYKRLGLVDNPAFVAGVVDARGRIDNDLKDGPMIAVKSTNRGLIEAINKKWNGILSSSKVSWVGSSSGETRSVSAEFYFRHAKNLYSFVGDSLRLRRDEGRKVFGV